MLYVLGDSNAVGTAHRKGGSKAQLPAWHSIMRLPLHVSPPRKDVAPLIEQSRPGRFFKRSVISLTLVCWVMRGGANGRGAGLGTCGVAGGALSECEVIAAFKRYSNFFFCGREEPSNRLRPERSWHGVSGVARRNGGCGRRRKAFSAGGDRRVH